MKEKYTREIEKCGSVRELDEIIGRAAFDEELTNAEYAELYEKAILKAKAM